MTDAVPDQAVLLGELAEQWKALDHSVAGLDEKGWRTPSPLPGWTVFDVLAHVVGTESLLLGDRVPDLEVSGEHIRNEIGTLNEKWIASLRPLTGEQLLQRFRDVTARRLTMLAETSPAEWVKEVPTPVGMAPYARFMRIRLFDCWMHELDIADALDVTGDPSGPRVETAFAELLAGIGRSVVKGAGAQDGSRITFELGGAAPRTLHIAVTGKRAEPVENLDRPADLVVTMDSGLFARLRGGRTTADAHAGEYKLTGDIELGERLVRSLAFTI